MVSKMKERKRFSADDVYANFNYTRRHDLRSPSISSWILIRISNMKYISLGLERTRRTEGHELQLVQLMGLSTTRIHTSCLWPQVCARSGYVGSLDFGKHEFGLNWWGDNRRRWICNRELISCKLQSVDRSPQEVVDQVDSLLHSSIQHLGLVFTTRFLAAGAAAGFLCGRSI